MAIPLRSAAAARLAVVTALALVTTGLITGCGSSTPAKPAYCSEVTKFKNAVAKLTDSGSPSAITSNVANVVSTGQAAVRAVKTAFTPQTTALEGSLSALEKSAQQLLSSGTRSAALQQIPGEVNAVKAAAGKFVDATHPKCS
jgi:hypothetical protein